MDKIQNLDLEIQNLEKEKSAKLQHLESHSTKQRESNAITYQKLSSYTKKNLIKNERIESMSEKVAPSHK